MRQGAHYLTHEGIAELCDGEDPVSAPGFGGLGEPSLADDGVRMRGRPEFRNRTGGAGANTCLYAGESQCKRCCDGYHWDASGAAVAVG